MVLNDRVGRKMSIMLSGVPSVAGLLMMGVHKISGCYYGADF